jgi:hypothetical protein
MCASSGDVDSDDDDGDDNDARGKAKRAGRSPSPPPPVKLSQSTGSAASSLQTRRAMHLAHVMSYERTPTTRLPPMPQLPDRHPPRPTVRAPRPPGAKVGGSDTDSDDAIVAIVDLDDDDDDDDDDSMATKQSRVSGSAVLPKAKSTPAAPKRHVSLGAGRRTNARTPAINAIKSAGVAAADDGDDGDESTEETTDAVDYGTHKAKPVANGAKTSPKADDSAAKTSPKAPASPSADGSGGESARKKKERASKTPVVNISLNSSGVLSRLAADDGDAARPKSPTASPKVYVVNCSFRHMQTLTCCV